MEYMTIKEASIKWNISCRRIQALCMAGRINGAEMFGRQWAIPIDAQKPNDARLKTGKYVKQKNDGGNSNEKDN